MVKLRHENSGEQLANPPTLTVWANADLAGFSSVEPTGVTNNGTPLFDVFWDEQHGGGTVRQVPGSEPVYIFHDPAKSERRPQMIVTLDRAAHIQDLHVTQQADRESGSYFTPIVHPDHTTEPVTLDMVMQQVADAMHISELRGVWSHRTLELPLGKLPGREGIMSLDELLEAGIIGARTHRLFMTELRDKIKHANTSPGLDMKLECAQQLNDTLQNIQQGLSVQLLRADDGGVLVPQIVAPPKRTSCMMVELTKNRSKGPIMIHTVAPGRPMPRHPIAQLHSHPETHSVDQRSLHNSAWVWSITALVKAPKEEDPHYLERTAALLRSNSFLMRLQDVVSVDESGVLDIRRREITGAARTTARYTLKEIAAHRAGLSLEQVQRLLATSGRLLVKLQQTMELDYDTSDPQDALDQYIAIHWQDDWQELLKEVADETTIDFTDGQPLKEYLIRKRQQDALLQHEGELAILRSQREKPRQEARRWLQSLLHEMEARRYDRAFVTALEAWSMTPASDRDRGYDGKGYNSGLIHFFEYRGAHEKHGRFALIDEPPTVDGFIAFTERLVDIVANREDPTTGNQVAVFADVNGMERIHILLQGDKGEFIVAFKTDKDDSPKLSAMFNGVTQQYFETMIRDVLSGNDRGQINRLGPGARPVYMHISKK